MGAVNIRTLTHNFSRYLKQVKKGNRITIMERNIPVAVIVPHNENITSAGWKRAVARVAVAGVGEDYVERLRGEDAR